MGTSSSPLALLSMGGWGNIFAKGSLDAHPRTTSRSEEGHVSRLDIHPSWLLTALITSAFLTSPQSSASSL